MTGAASLLPNGFADLEPFVADWALDTEMARIQKRCDTDFATIQHFYDAMAARVEAALDYLDTFDFNALPEREQRLFYLTLSLVEVANAVEFYKRPNSQYAFPPDRIIAVEPAKE
jgi:hypothetical protein